MSAPLVLEGGIVVRVVQPQPPGTVVKVVQPQPPTAGVLVRLLGERGIAGVSGELSAGQIEAIADSAADQAVVDLEPSVDLTILFQNALA